MREIVKLGSEIDTSMSKEPQVYSLFMCPVCGQAVKKIRRFGLKAKTCSTKCNGLSNRGIDRGNRRPYVKTKANGYIMIYAPNHPRVKRNKKKYLGEHILIMEQYLGRYLEPCEVVHHVNGVKDDNRIENLKVMTVTEHKSLHAFRRKRDAFGDFIKED